MFFGSNTREKAQKATPTQALPDCFKKQGGKHRRFYAGLYSQLSFSSRNTNLTNFLAVNASARLSWYLLTSLNLKS